MISRYRNAVIGGPEPALDTAPDAAAGPDQGSPGVQDGSLVESAEAGFVLVAVIFLVALLLLSLAIAAPKVAASIQRDKELETIHRGEQYKRAIRLYYKKFGTYPTSIDQLEKTNNIRFLRKRYLDPLTGKDDWKPVLYGQAHVCPLGFFGQPLGTSSIAGASTVANGTFTSNSGSSSLGSTATPSSGTTGCAGGAPSAGLNGTGGDDSAGAGSGSGSGAASGSAFGSGSGSGSNSGSSFGSNSGSSFGSGSGSSFGSNSGSSFGSGSGSASGSSFGSGTGTGGAASTGASNGLGTPTSTTLGGAPMVGVMPPLKKPSILAYKLKKNYNEWEFNYFPSEDQATAGANLAGGSNVSGTGSTGATPGTNGSSTFGSSSGSSFGGSSGGSSFGGSAGGSSFGGSSGGTGSGSGTGTNPPQ